LVRTPTLAPTLPTLHKCHPSELLHHVYKPLLCSALKLLLHPLSLPLLQLTHLLLLRQLLLQLNLLLMITYQPFLALMNSLH
jgi:hypothetical protein